MGSLNSKAVDEAVLRIEGLTTSYGGITVVKDASLVVGPGDAVCIIGANGAGKSSLLQCIAGVLPIGKGEIFLDGLEVSRLAPHLRAARGLFLVRERSQVLATMSVMDNLELVAFASARRVGKRKFSRDLEKVFDIFPKLRGKEKRIAGTLSGGEQRMVALGQAFVANPKIMLLDEPFLGLAPIVIDDLLRVIQDFRKERVSILLVEQNASLALQMAERGYVMETGRIILEGSAETIRENEKIRAAYLGASLT